MKFDDLSDDELGAMVRSRFNRLCEAHAAGATDTHPREQWNADSATLREYRNAAATGGTDESDPQPGLMAGGNNGNGGAVPAQDSALALDETRSRRRVEGVASVIKGYRRL